ncbi:hypothetical protein D9619_001442 [Psilocybe cf. subviscida]|uniref:DNA polymerase kappa n=1 Tax=Psilocybe cf. subviscida TaxID=2480587 RepID=A0A8H5F2G3_9AGAR|nr:hypothetical protein D9619_001442 [Psilocybe cf. subviscida]
MGCLSPPSASPFQRYTQMSRIFALVIGIDYYKSGKIWNLHSCIDDAKKIKHWLMNDLQVPADHISTLLDRQATKQNIEDHFSQHLLNNRCIERGDAILIYFAGHGSRLSAPDPWYPSDSDCQTVDVLCSYDHDTNTEQGRMLGISDRSFHAMMNDLCSSKGNNITVVLDCCFAPTQNRANIRDRSITRWTRTVKASPDDLYRGLWPTARVAPSATTSGFYTPQASHVVLGACSSGEKAIEDKNGGRLTTCLLRAASILHLHRTSYVQLMECASQNGGEAQTFLCIGEHKNEMIFNETPFPTDKAFVLASVDPDMLTLRISMGAIHGLTKGSQLSLHLHNRQRSLNPPIANAVVSEVHGTWCRAQPNKPLLNPPMSFWAKVTKWCTRRPFHVRIRQLSWTPRNGIAMLRRSLSFGIREKAANTVFDIQMVSKQDPSDVTLTLESKGIIATLEALPVTGGHSASIIKLDNNDPSAIIDQATRFSLHLDTGHTNGSLQDQVDMELYRIDPFSWSKAGDNLLSSKAEPIPYEEGALYQIILHNKSNTDLWPYLAYFDTSRLSITMIWSPRCSKPPLPSHCTLQIGSGVPGSEAFVFALPEGAKSDVSYLKLFFSSAPTSMKVIEQDLVSGLSYGSTTYTDMPNDAFVETTWGSLTRTLLGQDSLNKTLASTFNSPTTFAQETAIILKGRIPRTLRDLQYSHPSPFIMEPKQPQASQQTDSLVRRLAGPSSGKAGLVHMLSISNVTSQRESSLVKDQTEINRIIAEASKGSAFYENEKKKDKELTVRIEKILKLRDDVMQGADIPKIETSVDQLVGTLVATSKQLLTIHAQLIQLEEQRDLTQIIVHVDMDAFYANVELLDNPKLAGKPFAVVGKGVLTTASYDARKFGVRSGMAGFIAKKLCPELIFVKNRFWRYSEMSDQIMDIFHRYDPNMCPAGCDEGYLNITQYCEDHCITAAECVQEMREAVFKETKLTVSAGIAPNKNKPNGQFQLDFEPEVIRTFMRDLSIRKVPGIGRVNERLLDAISIKNCGDVYSQRAVVSLLDKQFGLVFLLRTYLGIASNTVQPHRREERKSIGAERTFSTLEDQDKILAKLDEVAAELEGDMESSGWTGKTVTLKYKLNTYQVFTRAKSLDHWVSKKEELYSIGKELLMPEMPLKLRLIGLRVTKLKDLRDTGAGNGIKRFFESAKDSTPRKKAKLEDDEAKDAEIQDADCMPGFHEGEEDLNDEIEELDPDTFDAMVGAHEQDEEHRQPDLVPEKPLHRRPPHSTPNAQASGSSITLKRRNSEASRTNRVQVQGSPPRAKQTKAKNPPSPPGQQQEGPQSHECPICGKTLQTDNHGLNAHIDFCLSRGAIMKAQVAASKTTAKPKASLPAKSKPDSKTKTRTTYKSSTKRGP